MDRLEFLNNELGTNFMSLDKINWDYISEHQILSEKFIREFQDKIDWNCISIYQKLSEDFIREFQDKVNWYYIIKYQELSNDFTEMLNSAIKIGISSFT